MNQKEWALRRVGGVLSCHRFRGTVIRAGRRHGAEEAAARRGLLAFWFFVDWVAGEAHICHSEGGAARQLASRHQTLAPTEESTLRTARPVAEARMRQCPRFLG